MNSKRKSLSRRDFLNISAGTAAGAILGSQIPAALAKTAHNPLQQEDILSLPNAATGVPYEVKDSINNGEPITLQYWEWALDRSEYEAEWAAAYMDLYPNVTIEVSNQSWDDYWTKLTVNIPAGQGPALWHMHTSKLTEFCDGGLMDPMPSAVADQDFLNSHWVAFSEGAMDCPTGVVGSRHFLPMGTMMPLLYINKKLWVEAGLTDNDVPKSWEDLRNVAKALTKTDSAGRVIQAGLQASWQEWLQNSIYQQGRYLFTEDGKRVQMNNDEYVRAVQLIKDLQTVDKVVDPEFPETIEAFTSEQAGMIMSFSWVTSLLRRNNPDLEWIPALLPTPDGELPPAYGNLRFAVEAVVNSYATPEVKAVAWDFWHFLYSADKRLIEDVSLRNGFIPPYDKLIDEPLAQNDPVVAVLGQGVEFGVVNDMPDVVRQVIQNVLLDSVLLADIPIQDALVEAEAAANDELAQRENWNIIERNYKHHDLMIPNQP